MIIGITTTYEEDHGYERANVEYLERIAQAGGTPVLLPPAPGGDEAAIAAAREVATRIDGLVLSGGGDIDPALYEEARLPETVNVVHTRDIYEMALTRYAHELDLPVLGICRGMQVMNVALGGTLYQDMNACGLTAVDHQQQPPYDATEQRADVASGSLLARLLCGRPETGMAPGCQAGWPADLETGRAGIGPCTIRINTMHHQALASLAPVLRVSAVSDDGIVEAVEDPTRSFFLGVQWHPEYLQRDAPLFEALVAAARS